VSEEIVRIHRGRVIYGPFRASDETELAELENTIGVPLPSPYREYLRVADGGTLDYDIRLPAEVGGEIMAFTQLFHLGRDGSGQHGYGTLLGEHTTRMSLWLSEFTSLEQILPIAEDGGGSLLCLDLALETFGRVVAFVRGLPDWTGLTQHDVGAVLALDFDAYLDALFIEEDHAQMAWEDAQHSSVDDHWRDAVRQWLDQGLPEWRTRPWAS
jgi:SMI1 / KNR4 family (SUKH-1)